MRRGSKVKGLRNQKIKHFKIENKKIKKCTLNLQYAFDGFLSGFGYHSVGILKIRTKKINSGQNDTERKKVKV